MKIKSAHFILFVSFLTACNSVESLNPNPTSEIELEVKKLSSTLNTLGGKAKYVLPHESRLGEIPQDPQNPLTPEKVKLGQLLFHETGISIQSKNEQKGSWSCATCHFSKAGFQDKRVQSVADGGKGDGEFRKIISGLSAKSLDAPAIRSPTILNVAYQENILWNGMAGGTEDNLKHRSRWDKSKPHGFNHLGLGGAETQAVIALGAHRQTHDNMAFDTAKEPLDILDTYPEYKTLFEKVFPGEPVTREKIALAIAAYERTLLPNQSPFQKFLKGEEEALSLKEIKGAQLFFGKAQCSSCHTGPALSTPKFYSIGLNDMNTEVGSGPDEATQKGRGGFTGIETDNYKFKVPQLYNLKEVGSLGHGGSFESSSDKSAIERIVRYKLQGKAENSKVPLQQLASDFTKMGKVSFSEDEIKTLSAFIETGLNDPNLKRYEPSQLPTGKKIINDENLMP